MTNILWYLTNQHIVIHDATLHYDVKPIPGLFSNLQGFNEVKRKKVKQQKMSSGELITHAEHLISILDRGCVRRNNGLYSAIKDLAECCSSYAHYLEHKLKTSTQNHLRPACQVSINHVEIKSEFTF